MHETARLVYAAQIRRQLRCSALAWRDLNEAIAQRDNDEVWHGVQALLTACANLSKLFRPVKTSRASRPDARQLRGQVLTAWLNPGEALLDRSARDYFDHFDERIDRWAKVPHTYYGDGFVAYPGLPFGMMTSFTLDGQTELVNHFRTFLADGDMTLYCGSDQDHLEVNLRPIWEACQDLDAKLSALDVRH